FAAYLAAHRVDAYKIVPSHLSALLEASRPERVIPEKCLIVGGEVTSEELAARVQRLKARCQLINHYGPTETTVGVVAGAVADAPNGPLPLGRPLAQSRVYVLDSAGHLLPPGGVGEIGVGGASVARGYLHRPGHTAERFWPDPHGEPGARLYRTGD